MPNKYGFKKPIDTSIRSNENITFLARMLMFEIINGALHEDRQCNFYHGNKSYSVLLRRGQYVLKISQLSKEIVGGERKIMRLLKILQKWYTEMQIEGKPFGTVITLLDYDVLTKMQNKVQNESRTKAERKQNESRTSIKSVKREESVESEQGASTTDLSCREVIEFYNKVYDKTYKSYKAFEKELKDAVLEHGVQKIKLAILKARYRTGENLFGKNFSPAQFFMVRNKAGPCDYIEEFSNLGEKETAVTDLLSFENIQNGSER